ncbi:elongase [Culex quinquefasciatus]|uniref:Elongation of very long chain fatty acids protein n=1 Tax=Culex quinquefasciatus TaxID=7176 RepID=B0W865_CULQU|nr:elongase [Culex quinquefasciatus]|eukprot:XP_001844899.1 elongase [Culex quinquefasciatus]
MFPECPVRRETKGGSSWTIGDENFRSANCAIFIEHDRVSGFWTWLFVLSKLPELGDTVFIVLRKQPLIFLHWYHHITVLMYSWFSYTEYTASARWFIVMNYCVHSVMYSYYALRALNFKPPRSIAMLITTLQLTQMVVGCAINIWAHGFLQTAGKGSCNISEMNIKLSIAMYFSYFVLFARFFYKTYLSTNARKGKRMVKTTVGGGSNVDQVQYTASSKPTVISASLSATATTAAQNDKIKAQ